MLIGVISDIHSNLPALEAVLARLDRLGAGTVLCAGDLVGYYTFPEEVVELVSRRGALSIAGNHDRAVRSGDLSGLNDRAARAAEWTRARMGVTAAGLLRRLRPRERLEIGGRTLLLVHGSPRDDDEYVFPTDEAGWPFGELGSDLLILGHTHVPWKARFGRLTVLNPGSVGQPRDGDARAAFATVETGGLEVRLRRVRYDVGRTARALTGSALPRSLAERLYAGQ